MAGKNGASGGPGMDGMDAGGGVGGLAVGRGRMDGGSVVVRGLGVRRGGGLEVRRSAGAGFTRGTRLVGYGVGAGGGVRQAQSSLYSQAFEVPAALFCVSARSVESGGLGRSGCLVYAQSSRSCSLLITYSRNRKQRTELF